MIECYDDNIYSYWSMVLGMICFAPFILILIVGGVITLIDIIIRKGKK